MYWVRYDVNFLINSLESESWKEAVNHFIKRTVSLIYVQSNNMVDIILKYKEYIIFSMWPPQSVKKSVVKICYRTINMSL